MKFEDMLLAGFLLALYAIASHDTEFMKQDDGNQTVSHIYKNVPVGGESMIRTHHRQ